VKRQEFFKIHQKFYGRDHFFEQSESNKTKQLITMGDSRLNKMLWLKSCLKKGEANVGISRFMRTKKVTRI